MSGEASVRDAAAPPRLFGLDAARGLALLGMFVAHTWFVGGEKIVDGRSAILFATVAGVSLGLITGGAAPPERGRRGAARVTVLVRGAVLVVLGLVLTLVVRPPIAVILDYYGFAFLLLVPLLFVPRAALGALAVLVVAAAPPLVDALDDAGRLEDLPDALAPFARWLVFGAYPMLVWLAYLLVGLVLARSDLRDRLTAALALVGGSLAAVAGYGAAWTLPGVSAAAHSNTTAEVVASGGVAVAIIGALSLLDSATGVGERIARVVRLVLSPLAAAGAMALTLYTAHAIVLAAIRSSSSPDRWSTPEWVLPSLVIASLVIAPLWRRVVGPGPLEAGLRLLTRLALGRAGRSRVAA